MAKQYAIMRMAKLKSTKDFHDTYKHNMREYNVTNADPSRLDLNYEAVGLNGRTYLDAYDEAVSEMQIIGANDKKIRKDAVRGMEFVLRYSYEADASINQEEWVAKNIEWLRDNFNPPGGVITFTDPDTGEEKTVERDNLVSVVVHNDEGVPHIHAVVIPIDDRGHLNSNYYIGGRKKMIELQDSYAKVMEQFGLERGEYKSIATPEKIARYLTEITKATDAKLPEPRDGETVDEYYERANIAFQNEKIHHRDEIVKQNQENIQARSEQLVRFEKEHEDAWENKKRLRKLARALGYENIGDQEIEEIIKKIERGEALEEAINGIDNQDVAEDILAKRDGLIKEQEQEKAKKERRSR